MRWLLADNLDRAGVRFRVAHHSDPLVDRPGCALRSAAAVTPVLGLLAPQLAVQHPLVPGLQGGSER